MSKKIEGFFHRYPIELQELLRFLASHELDLYLIGGAVRDFFDSGIFGHDHDFEIQSTKNKTLEQWVEHIDNVMTLAARKFELPLERLKFHIYRFKYEQFELEFAPAREEAYPDDKKAFGHSDFKVSLLVCAPVEKSWLRRDFTLNAMGIAFDFSGAHTTLKFLDPYGGLDDLKNQRLRPVSQEFHKDPVRFVRALRFSRKLQMTFGRELVKELFKFDLELLSLEALKRECLKDPFPVEILLKFFELTEKFEINIPAQMATLKKSANKLKNAQLNNIATPHLHSTLWLFWNEDLDWDEPEFLAFALFWGGKKKNALRAFRLCLIIKEFPQELFEIESTQQLRRHPYYGQLKKLVEFFNSHEWDAFAEAIPQSCALSGLKFMRPHRYKLFAQKKAEGHEGTERGDQKLLCFLISLKDAHDFKT